MRRTAVLELYPSPAGLALAEEGVDPFLEVLARVRLHDMLRAARWRPVPHDPVQLLFRASDRERRVRCCGAGDLLGARMEPVLGSDLVEQPGGAHLLGVHETREQDDVLRARDADQRRQASVVSRRQRVAERPGDGKAELRAGCTEAQIACGSDARAAATPTALAGGEGGLAHVLQRVEDAV